MHRRHGTRANLPANSEDRVNYKDRVQKEAFGIYRPLTEDSAEKVWDVMALARRDIKSFFGQYRQSQSELVIPADLGVTFVPRIKVRKAMRHGMLQRGFELGRMINTLEAHQPVKAIELAVPLGRTSWYSHHDRKLAFNFSDSEATHELAIEKDLVQELMDFSKASEVEVMEPNHMTLFKYGRAYDGKDLSRNHKEIVGGIVEEHFRSAELGSIVLGGLIIGDSYSQPKVML